MILGVSIGFKGLQGDERAFKGIKCVARGIEWFLGSYGLRCLRG